MLGPGFHGRGRPWLLTTDAGLAMSSAVWRLHELVDLALKVGDLGGQAAGVLAVVCAPGERVVGALEPTDEPQEVALTLRFWFCPLK